MADIFISHAREDRERAKALADTLTKRGWSVWWDGRMPVGMPYSDVIEQELAAAQCGIVLWSRASVKSQWVQNEATEGAARAILVPALIDDTRIPLEFRRLHTANLNDGADGMEELLSSIAALLILPAASASNPATPTTDSALTSSRPIKISAGVIALTLIAIVIVIAIWSKRDHSQVAGDVAAPRTAPTTTTIAAATNTITRTPSTTAERLETIDREQSAALIVGVRTFTSDESLGEVPYAVDDAIDLAHVLVFDERVRLIRPRRVVLAISGIPRKTESQNRLDKLRAAGVRIRSADHADILDALNTQARMAGENGALVVVFSTHGVTLDDQQYLRCELRFSPSGNCDRG